MAVSKQYKEFVAELFSCVGPVHVRSMFGGAGVFAPLEDGDVMFGLIARETIYLKADESNIAEFEGEGSQPFTYGREGKRSSMSYYEMPERLYDDPEELADWARKSLNVAISSRLKRGRAQKRRS